MRNEEHDLDAIRSHGPSCEFEDTSRTPQLKSKMAHRLEKLARLRIDPALINFPKGTPVFEGGYALVSRALLSSPSNNTKNQVVESKAGNVKSKDRIPNLEGDSRRPQAEGSNGEADHIDQEEAGEREKEYDGETSRQRKVVAVKKMKVKTSDELLRVLGLTLREAEVLASLSHENVITLEGFVEDVSKEVIWLVFPWEDNGNLKDFVALYDWEIPERIALIYDVSAGVEYLHTRRPPICHADLKSVNILVNSKCHALITDFGSAHHLATDGLRKERRGVITQPQPVPPVEATFCTSTNAITLTGIQCTTRWAAPEVLESDEFSLASDIWAFGWVAYEVMTNYIPFHDVKEAMVVKRVVRGDLPSIANDVRMLLIQELCSVVRGCWNIDSSKRPTAKDCRESIGWMPMISPSRGRAKDATGLVDRSAELLMQLGDMFRRQSDYPNASKYYDKALDIYADIADRRGEGNALVQLAQIRRLQHRYSEAIRSYTKALEIHTEDGNKQGRTSVLFGLAEVHRLRGEYGQAVTFYSECLQISTNIGDRGGRASALWGLASVHRVRDEYRQALTFYSECLQIRTDIGDRRGRADALWGLAEVHLLRNDYSKAFSFYSEDLQIRTDVGDRGGRAEALSGLAEVHRLQNEYDQAAALYSECLQILTDIGDSRGRADALWGLADVHRLQKEYTQAATFFSECLEIRNDIGDRGGRADALWGLAEVHRLRNEHNEAITCFFECLQIRTDIGDRRGIAEALYGLAEVYRLRKEYSQANKFFTEALETF